LLLRENNVANTAKPHQIKLNYRVDELDDKSINTFNFNSFPSSAW
jgi:hypothetical protein